MNGIGIIYDPAFKWIFARSNSDMRFGRLYEGMELTCSSDNTISSYATEDELEQAVDSHEGSDNFYKENAETLSILYLGESTKYPPIEPNLDED